MYAYINNNNKVAYVTNANNYFWNRKWMIYLKILCRWWHVYIIQQRCTVLTLMLSCFYCVNVSSFKQPVQNRCRAMSSSPLYSFLLHALHKYENYFPTSHFVYLYVVLGVCMYPLCLASLWANIRLNACVCVCFIYESMNLNVPGRKMN